MVCLSKPPGEAVIIGVAIDLAEKGEARPVGVQFAVNPQNRVIFLYPKMMLNPLIGSDGQDFLFPAFYFNLVLFPEDVKERTVFKGPGGKARQV